MFSLVVVFVWQITTAIAVDDKPLQDDTPDLLTIALRQMRCSQPKDIGRGRASFKRYFFNTNTKQCEVFYYGGNGGTLNNFKTLSECEELCQMFKLPTTQNPICLLPKKVGRGRMSLPRFYYSSTKKQCQEFVYGGHHGNKNNFETLEDCKQTCTNGFTGYRRAIRLGDKGKQKGGQDDTSDLLVIAMRSMRCSLPRAIGEGQSGYPRFFYNISTKQCEYFLYGGRGGNINNFRTLDECEELCKNYEHPPQKDPICLLPKDIGRGRIANPRYFFDLSKGKCEKFTFWGGLGNENNFDTKKKCEEKCEDSKKASRRTIHHHRKSNTRSGNPACNLPKDSGTGSDTIPRYYFNTSIRQCEKFIYWGENGNANNFETKKDCDAACVDPNNPKNPKAVVDDQMRHTINQL